LAVLLFLLLMMGRHPFAGRYGGQGDMPIHQAIRESRFAYGAQRNVMMMRQPPGTPGLGIVGNLQNLFERAFSIQGARGGRPTPQEWISGLQQLESNLIKCATFDSHYYLKTLSQCPWCWMEAQSGASLFPLHIPGSAGVLLNIDALWKQIDAVSQPGAAASFTPPTLEPTPEAKAIARNETTRYIWAAFAAIVALLLAAIGLGFGLTLPSFIAAGVAFFIVRSMMHDADAAKKFQGIADEAKLKWQQASGEWLRRAGPEEFEKIKGEASHVRRQCLDLPNERQRRLASLNTRKRELQLGRFLDRFKIDKTSIDGIGPGRKRILESYGVETAADITGAAVTAVPGFGRALTSKLLDWRAKCEMQFFYNPSQPLNPADMADVEREILRERMQLEKRLRELGNELVQAKSRILAVRHQLRGRVEAVLLDLAQAEANLKAIKRT